MLTLPPVFPSSPTFNPNHQGRVAMRRLPLVQHERQ
jgi:hypothetical protein